MQKALYIIFLLVGIYTIPSFVSAECFTGANGERLCDNYGAANGGPVNGGAVKVFVTEKIPGASCFCAVEGAGGGPDCPSNVTVDKRKYECTVEKGMVSFQKMIRDIIKWFVYIIMLLGVLALVGAGILWAMGSDSEEYTKKAKGWAKNIIIGLILLFTFRYILGFLAPWIFQ